MCWASRTLKQILGIGPYRPGTWRRSLHRKSMNSGARGNGIHDRWAGLTPEERRAIAYLIQEQRIIQQVIDDIKRRRLRQ